MNIRWPYIHISRYSFARHPDINTMISYLTFNNDLLCIFSCGGLWCCKAWLLLKLASAILRACRNFFSASTMVVASSSANKTNAVAQLDNGIKTTCTISIFKCHQNICHICKYLTILKRIQNYRNWLLALDISVSSCIPAVFLLYFSHENERKQPRSQEITFFSNLNKEYFKIRTTSSSVLHTRTSLTNISSIYFAMSIELMHLKEVN